MSMMSAFVWTILIISSRYHRRHSSIHRSTYKELLSYALVNSVRSVRVILAILYICSPEDTGI
ncbi:hypothetical protein V1506DRAFT_544768 [Lipomyces tetrasporus]